MSTARDDRLDILYSYEEIAAIKREARLAALRDALDCQPPTAENPREDAHQYGRFQGIMAYGGAIARLIVEASK